MKKKGKKNKKNLRIRIILIVLLHLITIAGYIAYTTYKATHKSAFSKDAYSIYIRPDDKFEDVLAQLNKYAKPGTVMRFKYLAKADGYKNKIKSGRYLIEPDMGGLDIFMILSKGIQVPVRFTFNNIRTKEEFAKRVSSQLMIDSTEVIKFLNNNEKCSQYGFTPTTISAMFIPNTYEFYWDVSMDRFLSKMKAEHDRFWNADRLEKAEEAGLSPVQVVTLASIVEEESNAKQEFAEIAGLYINRLRSNMPLQACPTVRFALQDFTLKRVTGEHISIDSPYNTYKNKGLPPGPIRFPSVNVVDSVLNYDHHDYLYMCAKEDFSGTHNFARGYEQHRQNASRYQQALNRLNIH